MMKLTILLVGKNNMDLMPNLETLEIRSCVEKHNTMKYIVLNFGNIIAVAGGQDLWTGRAIKRLIAMPTIEIMKLTKTSSKLTCRSSSSWIMA